MSYKVQENVLDKFLNNQEGLINQFKKGDITKREFIEEHYNFIQRLNLKPFKYRIDSFEKGIYNYEYYNMLAKYNYIKSKDKKIQQKNPQLVNKLQRDSNYYYRQKYKTTLKLLEYLEFRNVEAYYVNVKSKGLKDKLFEIVLMDYDNFILHSMSNWLLERLKEENVFIDEKRESIIDKYINEKY